MTNPTRITDADGTLTNHAANATSVSVQPANDPAQATSAGASGTAAAPAPPELDSKMVSGGEELRDHDFPTPNQHGTADSFTRIKDTASKPPLEEFRGGGKQGDIPGDEQKLGTVGNIMDQDLAEPDFAPQTG